MSARADAKATAAIGDAGAAAGQSAYGRRSQLPAPTDRVPLGPSLRVSPLCLGLVEDARTVPEAFDRGVNFFFLTADLHWPLYGPLRRGLAELLARGGGVRDQMVVCGVSYVTQPAFHLGAFAEALRSVPGLQRLDVVVAGGCYQADYQARLDACRALTARSAYGCRAFGMSFHQRPPLRRALLEHGLELGFIRYNPPHPGAQADLFPDLDRERGRRGLCYAFKTTYGHREPGAWQAAGLGPYWAPRKVDHYRFALTATAVDGLLLAPPTPHELHQALDALAEGPLAPEEEEHMIALGDLERTSSAASPQVRASRE